MDLSILNPDQYAAVTAPLGPVLVLAGAGSGKTRVLTYRIAYIIEQKYFAPENILALTFTNKAAKEMGGRVQSLLGGAIMAPTMGTFHSVCARLLRREIAKLGYSPSFTIYDTEDQRKVLRDVCDDLEIDKKFQPSLFHNYISAAKNSVQTPGDLDLGLQGYMHDLVARVYARYQNSLYKQNAVDFDDLLLLPIKLFEHSPSIKERYQKQFQYILVDEYQDTNQAQYRLLSLLVSNNNLFVVGDDAQSIYKFRGSTIANILNFERDYPECQVVTLSQNYRSTKHILHAADKVIALNPEQKPKKLWTDNPSGEKVVVHEAEDEYAEAEFVAQKIINLSTGIKDEGLKEDEFTEDDSTAKPFSILDQFLKKSRNPSLRTMSAGIKILPSKHEQLSQYAVLYRTHAQSRALEEVFVRSAIPYHIVGGVKFYERKEIKDVLGYLRLLLNPYDAVSLKRVLNEPARGLGEKSYQAIRLCIEQQTIKEPNKIHDIIISEVRGVGLSLKQLQAAEHFFKIFQNVWALSGQITLVELMQHLVKSSGLKEYYNDGTEVGQTRIENINELMNVAAKFNNLPWQEAVVTLLEEVALIAEADNISEGKDAVTLMTLHSAKGLEFDTVFFVGLEEGILPHSRSLFDPEELAEEIRLAYVGMTRAQSRLYLVHAKSRMIFGGIKAGVPSRILKALPEHSVKMPKTKNDYSSLGDGDLSYEVIDF